MAFIKAAKTEDVTFWKDMAERLLEEKNEIQRELDDHVECSRQVEKELETTLLLEEKKSKELQHSNIKFQNELDSIKAKLEQNNREMAKLQSEVQELNAEKVHLTRYIRELEQKNDDLERSERVITESVAVVQMSLNTAIERNAILESEVDEKETLKVKLQRLIDEMRDLKQESLAKERVPDNDRSFNGHSLNLSVMDSNRLRAEMETQTSSLKCDGDGNDVTGRPARIMALNLVNEILKKIGKLENKIAAHRANERNLSQSDLNNRNLRRPGRLSNTSTTTTPHLGSTSASTTVAGPNTAPKLSPFTN